MAITGYQGLPGSGKSYQVVSHVIVGAMREGRRVVTNISGVKHGTIAAYLMDEGLPQEKIGGLLYVDNEAIRDDNFFYDPDDPDSIVQPGDVVVIDEAWEFFEDGVKIDERVMRFFRYHRHYIHPQSGVACDIVLISQDIMDIGRKVRRVIEQTVSIDKLKELGTDKTFRLDIYQKVKVRGQPIYSEISRYNPRFFDFYSSYEGKGDKAVIGGISAKERRVESRGSLFQTPFFKYVMPLAFIGLIVFVWWGWKFFSDTDKFVHGKTPVDVQNENPKPYKAPVFNSNISNRPDSSGSLSPQSLPPSSSSPQISPPSKPSESNSYHIIGYYRIAGSLFVVLSSSKGRPIILKNPKDFNLDMIRADGLYNGEIVSTYTGVSSGGPMGKAVSKAGDSVVAPLNSGQLK